MASLTARSTSSASDSNAVELVASPIWVNPLRDEPTAADCGIVARFGLWGLLTCGVREALKRWVRM